MKTSQKKLQIIEAFSISAMASVALVTWLTVYGELYSPLKNWLKATFYHHWLGKGILAVLVFVLLGVLLSRITKGDVRITERLLALLSLIMFLGFFTIFGFYYYEVMVVSHG